MCGDTTSRTDGIQVSCNRHRGHPGPHAAGPLWVAGQTDLVAYDWA